MGRSRCFVPGCTSGYNKSILQHERNFISLFGCPKDDNILQKWINAIPRKDKIFCYQDAVCELHFSQDQILSHFDDPLLPYNTATSVTRMKKTLKPGSIPSIFPNLQNCPSTSHIRMESPLSSEDMPDVKINLPPEANSSSDNVADTTIFTYEDLKREIFRVLLPSRWWKINILPNFIVCSQWNRIYHVDKRVVIDTKLDVKVYFNMHENNLHGPHKLSSSRDLSTLLKKVDDYVTGDKIGASERLSMVESKVPTSRKSLTGPSAIITSHSCCIQGCHGDPRVESFLFPTGKMERRNWARALKGVTDGPIKFSKTRICQFHFKRKSLLEEEVTRDPKTKKKLETPLIKYSVRSNAVPTYFRPRPRTPTPSPVLFPSSSSSLLSKASTSSPDISVPGPSQVEVDVSQPHNWQPVDRYKAETVTKSASNYFRRKVKQQHKLRTTRIYNPSMIDVAESCFNASPTIYVSSPAPCEPTSRNEDIATTSTSPSPIISPLPLPIDQIKEEPIDDYMASQPQSLHSDEEDYYSLIERLFRLPSYIQEQILSKFKMMIEEEERKLSLKEETPETTSQL